MPDRNVASKPGFVPPMPRNHQHRDAGNPQRHDPRDRRRRSGVSARKGWRRALAATIAALAVLGVNAAPAPAAAKARPACDRLGGTTLAANDRVRLFRDPVSRSEASRLLGYRARAASFRMLACSYRTRSVATLWWEDEPDLNAEPTTYTWAINGDYVAVSASESGNDEPTDRSAGISWESLTVWNGRTGKQARPASGLTGLRFTELVVSRDGSVGAIGNPYRFGGAGEDGRAGPATESAVMVYEPRGVRPPGSFTQSWRRVAAGPVGSFSGLALSARTLVWSGESGLGQTPLR